ncbi:hypothetical protein EVAR_51293_1 [Eumeta japonica]|uniref:Uncharacterized protein n=1 Tax=Eumeta variegata TaxID=151549 RepID=A0A4C1XU73_EUMVA|nr:hypothetical protein EVAR_51293_1 [Eumeta japonica]
MQERWCPQLRDKYEDLLYPPRLVIDDFRDLMMEQEGAHGKFVIKRRNSIQFSFITFVLIRNSKAKQYVRIEFELICFVLESTLVLYDIEDLKMETIGHHEYGDGMTNVRNKTTQPCRV